MNPIDKLNKILLETDNSFYSLHKEIGLKHTQNLYDIKNGKVKSISLELATKIHKRYPQYSVEWLQGSKDLDDYMESKKSSEEYNIWSEQEELKKLIPMYNFPAAAGGVEMYNDPNDVKVVGYLSIPGTQKGSFALPVHGHSMYPTLENGSWCVVRPIEDRAEIMWGEIYYIEWSDYRVFKRLLEGDKEDEVILWSDNQAEKIGERAKYSRIIIKKEKIRKLCLLTEILKKPNY